MMMNLMTVLVKKVFISSKPSIVCLLCPPPCGPFSIQESAVGGLSYKVKKGIFRLCSLETKNSAVPLCFRIPNPALRRVTCAIRTLLMPSASQNLLPDALSAQTCGDCSQPMTFPLWRRLSAYSFRSMHFPICSFQRYRRCSGFGDSRLPEVSAQL